MRPRRHHYGDEFAVDRFQFRIVVGDKVARSADGIDHVLQLWHDGTWHTLEMGICFAVMDVVGENEDFLYANGKGGGYTLTELRSAYKDGWQQAWSRLQQQRARADEQRHLP